MARGKSLELFLVNGTADSIETAELSNWSGKAIKIPRIEVQSCTRDDICQAGVYFLFCNENDEDSVYIGEAENVKDRLVQHIRDNAADKEKFYWTKAVIFIGRDLNKALIRYLENRLVEIARACNRYTVLTKNTYKNTVMKESQVAAMEEFIDNIKIVIGTLGYNVLVPVVEKTNGIAEAEYSFTTGAASAKGVITSEGFVVLKGAKINEKVSEKSVSASTVRLREKHTSEGRVKDLETTEDILFSSSSAAADFVLGYSVSGPKIWKNKDGKTLKEVEQEESGE